MTATPHAAFDATRSGVYATPLALDHTLKAAARAGLAHFDVVLGDVKNKGAFLAVCSQALEFPPSFGGNWDAFADSLQDFSWHPARGYLLRMRDANVFARAAPVDYGTAVEILRESAEYWKHHAIPFIVLIDGATELPTFSP